MTCLSQSFRPERAVLVGEAVKMDRDKIILANHCGRGDKGIFTVAEALGTEI
ncbi:hypothetical protein [Sphingorhabdus sp. YGSMI21]|uniref:hypothetical protein n=1 Tax=Sphingorhabdus sp. YGSMI21 TaxID=2077182 RepID=UPI0013DB0B2F|nr:hypothetical protein [Sphingorhabdus sp. YGSMI21]